jgi:hypothetical protein
MIALPMLVYVIALSGALVSTEKMWGPVTLALGMLLSATVAWRFIRWRNPGLA